MLECEARCVAEECKPEEPHHVFSSLVREKHGGMTSYDAFRLGGHNPQIIGGRAYYADGMPPQDAIEGVERAVHYRIQSVQDRQ